MNANSHLPVHRSFAKANDLFSGVDSQAAAYLIAAGSDISIILADDGVVIDVAYRDASLARYAPEDWVGKAWGDTVTPECVLKIEALLGDEQDPVRRRQVNHPAPGQPDLPVEYAVIAVAGLPIRVAVGNDLSKIADVQQRLVRTQAELEAEYGAIREAESRYRTFFYMSERPGLIVEATTRRVLDANPAAAKLFGRPAQRLIGSNAPALAARSDRERVADILQEVQLSGADARFEATLEDGTAIAVLAQAYRENGRNNLLVRFTTPAAAEALSAPAATGHENLIDLSPEPMVITDPAGAVLEANAAFLDATQILNLDKIIGRNLNHWIGASSIDLQVLLTKVREERQVRRFATILRDDLERERAVQVSAVLHETAEADNIAFLIFENGAKEAGMNMPSAAGAADATEFAELVGRVPLKELIRQSVEMIERLCIEAALKQTKNNRAAAAEMLGLSRQSLYIKLKRYNVDGEPV